MEQITELPKLPADHAQSPSTTSTATEPTDDELRELTRKAREKHAGAFAEFTAHPPMPKKAAAEGLQVHALPVDDGETWEPPCASCGEPIGYRARNGYFVGPTECAKCRSGSVEERLAASGISEREIAEPLEGLKSYGPDGKPYSNFDAWMTFLRNFAALVPHARMDPPFGFVCGHLGVGKSAGAQRALRDAIRNGCQGRYIRLSDLMRAVYDTYSATPDAPRDERTEARFNFYANQLHLLVIDQIGQNAMSDHARGVFFDVIDGRWANRKPTILISNYLPQEDSLGSRMSDMGDDLTTMRATIDRMRGGARANLFVIRGASWRGHEGAEVRT